MKQQQPKKPSQSDTITTTYEIKIKDNGDAEMRALEICQKVLDDWVPNDRQARIRIGQYLATRAKLGEFQVA